jgi:hypothetical protein
VVKYYLSNINEEKQSKWCCDQRTSSRTYAVDHPQRQMIVYYDRYDQFQQVPCGDFPREGLTGAKFGVKILDAHRRKLPESPADQNNVEHQRRKISFEDMNECMKRHG